MKGIPVDEIAESPGSWRWGVVRVGNVLGCKVSGESGSTKRGILYRADELRGGLVERREKKGASSRKFRGGILLFSLGGRFIGKQEAGGSGSAAHLLGSPN